MLKEHYLALVIVFLLPSAFSNNIIQTSRYTTTNTAIVLGKDNLLQQVITIHFPQSIITVRDAIEYLLVHSGYHLRDLNTQAVEIQYRMEQRLPILHRRLGPTQLSTALQVLMGSSFVLIDDPLYREIRFIVNKDRTGSIHYLNHEGSSSDNEDNSNE